LAFLDLVNVHVVGASLEGGLSRCLWLEALRGLIAGVGVSLFLERADLLLLKVFDTSLLDPLLKVSGRAVEIGDVDVKTWAETSFEIVKERLIRMLANILESGKLRDVSFEGRSPLLQGLQLVDGVFLFVWDSKGVEETLLESSPAIRVVLVVYHFANSFVDLGSPMFSVCSNHVKAGHHDPFSSETVTVGLEVEENFHPLEKETCVVLSACEGGRGFNALVVLDSRRRDVVLEVGFDAGAIGDDDVPSGYETFFLCFRSLGVGDAVDKGAELFFGELKSLDRGPWPVLESDDLGLEVTNRVDHLIEVFLAKNRSGCNGDRWSRGSASDGFRGTNGCVLVRHGVCGSLSVGRLGGRGGHF